MKRAVVPAFAIALALVATDQATKALVRASLSLHVEQPVLPGVLVLTNVQNRGAAFGLFQSSTLLLSLVSLGVCVAIVAGRGWWLERGVLTRAAAALIFGGALGNLIDRLILGYVTDFLQFTPTLPLIGRWPAFNVADSALTIGALLLATTLARNEPETKEGEAPAEPTVA